jgi:hypothetical protein
MSSTGNALGMVATVAVITTTAVVVGSYFEGTWWNNNKEKTTLQMAREYTTTLHAADESRKAQERLLDAIENALRLANNKKFESINVLARPNKAIFEAWIANFRPNNLKMSLKQLDTALENLTVKVDGVLIVATTMEADGADNVQQMLQELKQRKSLLSQQLVLTMERSDTLWLSYYRFMRDHKTEETRLAHKAQVCKKVLDEADKSRKSQERLLANIEGTLMRARYDSDYGTKTTKENWTTNFRPRDLRSTLAELDTNMFNLVAKVDGVLIYGVGDGPDSAHVLQELKERKQLLSKHLVQAMERIDALLEAYSQQ